MLQTTSSNRLQRRSRTWTLKGKSRRYRLYSFFMPSMCHLVRWTFLLSYVSDQVKSDLRGANVSSLAIQDIGDSLWFRPGQASSTIIRFIKLVSSVVYACSFMLLSDLSKRSNFRVLFEHLTGMRCDCDRSFILRRLRDLLGPARITSFCILWRYSLRVALLMNRSSLPRGCRHAPCPRKYASAIAGHRAVVISKIGN